MSIFLAVMKHPKIYIFLNVIFIYVLQVPKRKEDIRTGESNCDVQYNRWNNTTIIVPKNQSAYQNLYPKSAHNIQKL